MSARVKPRIRRVFNLGGFHEWRCSDLSGCYAIAWGRTPEEAYESWLAIFARCRRSRLE